MHPASAGSSAMSTEKAGGSARFTAGTWDDSCTARVSHRDPTSERNASKITFPAKTVQMPLSHKALRKRY